MWVLCFLDFDKQLGLSGCEWAAGTDWIFMSNLLFQNAPPFLGLALSSCLSSLTPTDTNKRMDEDQYLAEFKDPA